MTQHTCRGHRTTHRSWLFPSAVWVSGIELRLLSIWSTFSWSATHCSHLSGEKQRQKKPNNIKNQFNPVRLPHFPERSWQDVSLLVCGAYHGGLGVGHSPKRDGKWDNQEGVRAVRYHHGLGLWMCTTPLPLHVGTVE